MRAIDADALMEDINDSINEAADIGITVDADYLWGKLNDAIRNAPTIQEGLERGAQGTPLKAVKDEYNEGFNAGANWMLKEIARQVAEATSKKIDDDLSKFMNAPEEDGGKEE